MEKRKPKEQELRKIKTNILGLDRLLFEGLDLSHKNTVIVIKGNETTERTLLGLQMIYGIAQSLNDIAQSSKKCSIPPIVPTFISTYLEKEYMDDLLLDVTIASCIQKMTEKAVSGAANSDMSNSFAQEFFNMKEILCNEYAESIYEHTSIGEIKNNTDRLICEEAIYYSNRTNALHFRVADRQTDERNILYRRKFDSISEYFKGTGLEDEYRKDRIKQIGDSLGFPLIDMRIAYKPTINVESLERLLLKDNCSTDLVAIDLRALSNEEVREGMYSQIIEAVSKRGKKREEKGKPKVSIFIIPDRVKVDEHLVDISIEMETEIKSDYLLQYLSITKNRNQISVLGWHQYKRRDYGIEIYPSLHTYFQQRRYLQRALVFTHSNVITDTFQQYLDKNPHVGNSSASYGNYLRTRDDMADKYYQALYPQYSSDYTSVDILERILLSDGHHSQKIHRCEVTDNREHIHDYRGGVTAVIGEANAYKRFLTFGGIFSSALHREHTLLLLLNKDDEMIRRRLACPARTKKSKHCTDCKTCYSYIHSMNICMGNITPDEFIYFLERQIDIGYADGKKIKRIVIDDLQILDFCFPLLRNDSLFISALVSVCRDKHISLHILCDKSGSSVEGLRAVADNVLCTDRDENGQLRIYVERFAGYNNTPSKIYCGKIKSVKELFECYKRKDEKEKESSYYVLNNMQIEDVKVSSADSYWINHEAKAIAAAIKKK